MAIKAIETEYAGCLFRSRLEARWAVVLDHLGYEWRYELEGFELAAGRYLPDFYLPAQRKWLEVKGAAPTEYDMRRAWEFGEHVHARGERFAILVGDIPRPVVHLHNMVGLATGIQQIQYVHLNKAAEAVGPEPDRPPEPMRRLRDAYPMEGSFADAASKDCWLYLDGGPVAKGFVVSLWTPDGPVAAALKAGRSARFTGATA
jgi:hypothetical protein